MLSRLGTRPSPGTVLSVLAVVIALGGVGIAAIPNKKGVISGCYSKKTGDLRLVDKSKKGKKGKCGKGEKAISWNQKGVPGQPGAPGLAGTPGQTGPKGDKGDKGDPGTAGTNGADGIDGSPGQAGSSGPGLLFGTGNVSQDQTTFTSLAGANSTTQATAFTPIPPGAVLTARDFSVRLNNPVNVGSVSVALQVNGADQLSCTILAAAQTCSSGATVALNPGDNVNFRNTSSGGAANNQATFVARIVF